jgi:hypothetical protein
MFHVRNPQDLGAGVLLLLVGIGGLWFGREYAVGTAGHMGPGYMPRALSSGLIIFGIVVGLRAVKLRAGGERIGAIERIGWRTNFLILASIISFALLIRTAGLAMATFAVTLLSALASQESRWKETIALAFFLTFLCVVVFVYALRQAMPVFGG